MRTFIIGAGASKAYSESPTNCRMPIANDFFQTFNKLNPDYAIEKVHS